MTPIVIHVGPGKCGSSSIQHELRTRSSGIALDYDTWHVNPGLVLELSAERPDPVAQSEVDARFARQSETSKPLVLSHEVLFKHPLAVRALAMAAFRHRSDIVLIGYSRRQSSFVGSSYSEWLFPLRERQQENWELMLASGMQPQLFTGVERHYIAAVLSDFHSARQKGGHLFMNWLHSYTSLESALVDLPVRFSVGQLDTDRVDFALIEDFYRRAGVDDERASGLIPQIRINPTFHPDFVEAVGIGVLAGQTFPEPGERRQVVRRVTQKLGPSETSESPFLDGIRAYIDGFYFGDNQAFCERYGLDSAGFAPSLTVSRHDVDTLLAEEQQRRVADPQILDEARCRVILTLTKLSFLNES